jgi:hypothetical protein
MNHEWTLSELLTMNEVQINYKSTNQLQVG